MRNKLIFLTGVGVGYVLGARAGRQRYEQLIRAGRRLKENPTVQETAGILQAQAGELVSSAKGTVSEKLSNTAWGAKVSNYLSESHHENAVRAGSARVPAAPPYNDF